jgi:hypothetical protein
MNIERIDGDTRIVYHIYVYLSDTSITLRPGGATIFGRATPRSKWVQKTNICYKCQGTWKGYVAYDCAGKHREPVNHRRYDLVIPEDVKAETLANLTIAWEATNS